MFKQEIIFTQDECQKIINYHKIIDNVYDSANEKRLGVNYLAYNIPYNDEYEWAYKRMLDFFTQSTNQLINDIPQILHMHRYGVNCSFIKHHDKNKPSRIWNVGVQLNDNYDGGDLNLFYDDKITVNKQMGTGYIFRPEIHHEVTKVTNNERWSLILFLHHNNIVNDLTKKTLF